MISDVELMHPRLGAALAWCRRRKQEREQHMRSQKGRGIGDDPFPFHFPLPPLAGTATKEGLEA